MRSQAALSIASLFLAPLAVAQTASAQDGPVRINEIQVIGTHNSYHAGLAPSEAALLQKMDPKEASALDYRHAPLTVQLNAGMRLLELDVYPDPEGGRYLHPKGLEAETSAGLPQDPAYYPAGLMEKPGFKVMHKADTDYRSNCQPFIACLQEIRAWSQAHPEHVPLFLFIEPKALKTFTTKDLDNLDEEILSVFQPTEMIVPDEVRGTRTTMREAVEKDGWPTLDQARGKVLFFLSREEVSEMYLTGHPQLKGRVLFPNGTLGKNSTVFTVQQKNKHNTIQKLVADNMLVLTRTDADMVEARINDQARRESGFASGAQLLSTDYPSSEPAVWTGYTVRFPHNEVARCNPVLRPKHCVSSALEPAPPVTVSVR